MAILKKFIGANTIGAEKIQLENDQSLVALNQAGSAEVPLFKLDGSDVFKLMKLPRADAALAAPSDAKDLVTKEYVDSSVSSGVLDLIGEPDGIAPLGPDGKIPNQFYSSLVITDVFVVADIAARDALSAIEEGDVAKVLDAGAGLPKTYIYGGSSWIEIESGSDVDSVNGYTGNVVLATSDIAESGVTNLYYTPARKAAIEAYADTAEADAIASANSYTDAEVAILEGEDLTFLKLDGSRPMTGQLDLAGNGIEKGGIITLGDGVNPGGTLQFDHIGNNKILSDSAGAIYLQGSNGISIQATEELFLRAASGDSTLQALSGSVVLSPSVAVSVSSKKIVSLADPTDAQDAATKAYVDAAVGEVNQASEISFAPAGDIVATDVQAAIEEVEADYKAEDLTFLKLDGSRPMVGPLDMNNQQIDGVTSITATGTIQGSTLTATTDLYVDGIQIQKEITGELYIGGAIKVGGSVDLQSTQKVINMLDPVDPQDASTKGYVDNAVSALETEDLTFLKLNGSRPMTGNLDLDGNNVINVTEISGLPVTNLSVTAGAQLSLSASANMSLDVGSASQIVFSESTVSFGSIENDSGDMMINAVADLKLEAASQIKAMAELSMESAKIVNVATPTASGDAATKGYVDGQLDLLSVQQLVHETKTLTGGDLVSIDVGFAIQGQPWIQVGRVSLVPGDDFTVSGTTITWAGSVAPLGAEALEAGDKLSIFYMKAVNPFV